MKRPSSLKHSGPSGPHVSKKCPECMEYMPLNATACPACKLPVGKVTKEGLASRKTDWRAYAVAIAAWLFFIFYIWWAFLRES